ncbi:MAG: hypothetical protein JNK78_01375 [Planctomycetes bacterium]|nr:hypothetical protein [Planctomycetota bacterium]
MKRWFPNPWVAGVSLLGATADVVLGAATGGTTLAGSPTLLAIGQGLTNVATSLGEATPTVPTPKGRSARNTKRNPTPNLPGMGDPG